MPAGASNVAMGKANSHQLSLIFMPSTLLSSGMTTWRHGHIKEGEEKSLSYLHLAMPAGCVPKAKHPWAFNRIDKLF